MTRRQLMACLPTVVALRSAHSTAAPFERIDSHVHIHREASRFVSLMREANWRALSICVSEATAATDVSNLDHELRDTAELSQGSGKRIAWAATFDARSFEDPGFPERTLAGLRRCFDQGAVGVKVWKNVGLGMRSKSGAWLLPDHPALMAVYGGIQQSGKTLLVHLAGTSGGWMPIDSKNPEYRYYLQHPEWNLYGRKGAPTKAAIMAARDRILAGFPKLRVVGCHIGSMEDDLANAARHLDTYPNFAVDTAAKVRYLAHGKREQVREFLLRYQDRILYGTDFTLGAADQDRAWKSLHATYEKDWAYFAGSERIEYLGREVQGLALPESVLRKIFYANAAKWLPM